MLFDDVCQDGKGKRGLGDKSANQPLDQVGLCLGKGNLQKSCLVTRLRISMTRSMAACWFWAITSAWALGIPASLKGIAVGNRVNADLRHDNLRGKTITMPHSLASKPKILLPASPAGTGRLRLLRKPACGHLAAGNVIQTCNQKRKMSCL